MKRITIAALVIVIVMLLGAPGPKVLAREDAFNDVVKVIERFVRTRYSALLLSILEPCSSSYCRSESRLPAGWA